MVDQAVQRASCPPHLSSADATLLRTERDPQLRNTIAAVIVLDRVPDRSVLLDRLERMSRSVPGCRHRLVAPALALTTPRWIVDRDFDLSYHLRWIAAPEPHTLDAVLGYAQRTAMSGLDHDRPLWNFTVVEGLEGGRAAVVVKLHHALTDGVGGIAMIPHLVDATREPADVGPMPPVPDDDPSIRRAVLERVVATRGAASGLVRGARDLALRGAPRVMRHPAGAAATVARNVQALGRMMKPPTERLSPLMVERRGWWRYATLDVDLTAMRAAARAHHATLNDAFLTALGNGFARYHDEHGTPVRQLRAAVAVNTRRAGDSPYGNHVRGGTIVVPVGLDDPAKYMAIHHDTVALLREDVAQPLADAIGTVLASFGPFVSGLMGRMMKHCDFAASNVPGVDTTLYLGGAEMLALYGFGPSMGTACNSALVSYRDTAFIGLNVDEAAVPDVDVLVDCMRRGFDVVLALAT